MKHGSYTNVGSASGQVKGQNRMCVDVTAKDSVVVLFLYSHHSCRIEYLKERQHFCCKRWLLDIVSDDF